MERVADIKRQAQNYVKQGMWDEAIRAYEKLAQVADPDPYLQVLIGDVHVRRGDPPAAIDAYRLAVEGYRASGLIKNAVAVAKRLLRSTEDRVPVLALLGELTAQDGLAGDAAAFYLAAAEAELAAGNREAAAEYLGRGVAVSPMHADCSNRLVDLRVEMDRPQDAARELLRLAEALRMAGREDPVPFLIERARALDPTAELPSVEPAGREGASSQAREVIAGLREALGTAGQTPAAGAKPVRDAEPAAPERLADLESTGLDKPAGRSATPAAGPKAAAGAPKTSVFSRSADALARAAEAAHAEPPDMPAAAAAETAGGPAAAAGPPAAPFVEPEVPAGPRATSRSVSVRDEAPGPGALIDLSKILEEFKQGLEQQIGPDDAKSHYDMAMAYMEMNLLGDAVAELAAASHDPALRPKCCELLGQCYLRQNLPHDAERILRRGLETPDLTEEASLSLRYHLALALGELGGHDEAHELMEQVVRVRSDFMDAATHLERLRLRRAS